MKTASSKGTLYFKHSNGKLDVVKESVKYDECFKHIQKFVKKLNPKFVIYYTRVYEVDGVFHFDIGSHSEFFYWTDKDLLYEKENGTFKEI